MRLFMFMLVLVVIAIGLGLYRGWFTFTTAHKDGDDNKVTVGVEVDKDKIKSDAEAARQKVQGVGATVSGGKTMHGTLVKIGDAGFTMMDESNNEVSFQTESSTKVRMGDSDARLINLQAGDHVTVVYHEKDGKNLAKSVAADRAK